MRIIKVDTNAISIDNFMYAIITIFIAYIFNIIIILYCYPFPKSIICKISCNSLWIILKKLISRIHLRNTSFIIININISIKRIYVLSNIFSIIKCKCIFQIRPTVFISRNKKIRFFYN